MPEDRMNNMGFGMSELNRFAMSDGLLLGAYGLVAFAAILLLLPYGLSGAAGMASVAGWLLLLFICSRRRCSSASAGVSSWRFGRAYIHSLLTELYASVWVALATYFWFRYFDDGYFTDNIIALSQRPEMQEAIAEMEGNGMLDDLYLTTGTDNFTSALEFFRSISPETFCGMTVSWTLIAAPIAALVIALICKKNI